MSGRPDVFIVAGEPSGDLIASLLIRRMKKLDPEVSVVGVGGDQMAEAGAEIRFNIVRDLAIIGIVEVFSKFGKIKALFQDTVAYLREHRPRVLVVIDYPGFNLRLARHAHLLGIKVVYYVVPQVWAWHKSRVHKIRECVDRALVVLPFEEGFLKQYGVNAEYIGHPLLDVMILTMKREEVFERFKLDPKKKVIGLLPGSRKREIDSLLPPMLEAAELVQKEYLAVQFVLPRAASIRKEQIDRHLARARVDVAVFDSFRYNVRSVLDFAVVASGTATLETGLLLTPMAIVYRMSPLTFLLAKMLVKIPYAGLINIVAGDFVVPELLQDRCRGRAIADCALAILRDPAEAARVKERLAGIKEKLGGPGASRRAAEIVLEMAGRPKAMAKDPPAKAAD